MTVREMPATIDVAKLAWDGEVCGTVAEAAAGKDCAIEPKFDGIRLLVNVTEGGCKLYARSGNGKTGHLVAIQGELEAAFPPGTWLDSEAVAFSEDGVAHEWGGVQSVLGGNPKPEAQQERVTLVVFDLIAHGGIDARPLPFRQRRELLEASFDKHPMRRVVLSPLLPATEQAHEMHLAAGFEGSMVKRLDARYASGRRGYGLAKLKPQETDEAVVVGYKEGEGSFAGLVGALVLGMHRDGKLVEVTRCSGMTYALRCEISADREAFLGRVIEFAHHGVMPSGGYRHPQFKRFRDGEKSPEQCVAPAEATERPWAKGVEDFAVQAMIAPEKLLVEMKKTKKSTEPTDFDPATAGQSGRGPTGRLRNFKSMSDAKLAAALAAVEAEANDPEALDALRAEAGRRA